MIRRLKNIAVWISLAMAVCAGTLWARSYSGTDMAYFGVHGWRFGVDCSMGRLELKALGPHARPAPLTFDRNTDQFWGRPRFWLSEKHGTWRTLGWGYGGNTYAPYGAYRALIIPLWFPIVVSMLLLAMAWRRRRARPGVCPVCGYDLRATPDRCPECGASIAGDPTA